jgi:hypothetical protein
VLPPTTLLLPLQLLLLPGFQLILLLLLQYGLPALPEEPASPPQQQQLLDLFDDDGQPRSLLPTMLDMFRDEVLLPNEVPRRELADELRFHPGPSQQQVNERLGLMNPEQRLVYDSIMQTLTNRINEPNPFVQVPHALNFIDAPGGTGKSFVLNTIILAARATGRVVLRVAFSGIAA